MLADTFKSHGSTSSGLTRVCGHMQSYVHNSGISDFCLVNHIFAHYEIFRKIMIIYFNKIVDPEPWHCTLIMLKFSWCSIYSIYNVSDIFYQIIFFCDFIRKVVMLFLMSKMFLRTLQWTITDWIVWPVQSQN